MAEFKEVTKQFERMCKAIRKDRACDECPIKSLGVKDFCTSIVVHYPEKSEHAITQWAAEHPEPLYPTWEQRHERTFPNRGAYSLIMPCFFMPKENGECGGNTQYEDVIAKCGACRNRRIPADIAEKLGIKPGEEWEKHGTHSDS